MPGAAILVGRAGGIVPARYFGCQGPEPNASPMPASTTRPLAAGFRPELSSRHATFPRSTTRFLAAFSYEMPPTPGKNFAFLGPFQAVLPRPHRIDTVVAACAGMQY